MLYARVVPLLRLPRHLGFFDYTVPPELEDTIIPGQIVTISFKKKLRHGVVWTLSDTPDSSSPTTIKPIETILASEPLINEDQRHTAVWIAQRYAVSIATIADMMTPEILKRPRVNKTIEARERSWLSALTPSSHPDLPDDKKHLVIRVDTLQTKLGLYQSLIRDTLVVGEQLLLLCPTVNDAHDLAAWLHDQDIATTLYTGDLSKSALLTAYQAIAQHQAKIIIGTRTGILLNFPQLKTIIIDQSERPEHKQYDQNPRYDAREIACYRAQQCGAKLISVSAAPRLEEWHAAHHHSWTFLDWSPSTAIPVINLANELRSGNYSFIADELQSEITSTLTSDRGVFLFLNRKGASSVACKNCDELFVCEADGAPLRFFLSKRALICPACSRQTSLPEQCPSCGGRGFRSQGIGTEKIALHLRELFPTAQVMTLEQSDSSAPIDIPQDLRNTIVVGTSLAQTSHPNIFARIGLMGIILTDPTTGEYNARATETQWQMLSNLLLHARSHGCAAALQAFNPEHPFVITLARNDYESFAANQAAERTTFHLPPYTSYLRIRTIPGNPHNPKTPLPTLEQIAQELDKTSKFNNIKTVYITKGINAALTIVLDRVYAPAETLPPEWCDWLSNLPPNFLVDPDPLIL